MFEKLLLALDQFDHGHTALDFTEALARRTGADVSVLHVWEFPVRGRALPLVSRAEAEVMVDEAVFCLRMGGVGADGRVLAAPSHRLARCIVGEAANAGCDAIVLGSRRLRGFDRLSGHGVREQITRLTVLPVVTAPTAVPEHGRRAPGPGRRTI